LILLAFLAHGHTPKSGTFRSHVARLMKFLNDVDGISDTPRKVMTGLVERAEPGDVPEGEWLKETETSRDPWPILERAA
jgi:hypothetical protein